MEWNQRLAAVRKAAGLTQEQLGDLVGVTRQSASGSRARPCRTPW